MEQLLWNKDKGIEFRKKLSDALVGKGITKIFSHFVRVKQPLTAVGFRSFSTKKTGITK